MQFDIASPELALRALTKQIFDVMVTFVDASAPDKELEVDSEIWMVDHVTSGGSIDNFPALQEIVLIPS